jgi:hypothetical protein
MVANPIWIAGYGGAPAAIGASPVWIASRGPTAPAGIVATESKIVGYGGPVTGASPVWLASTGGAPPAGIGAAAIWLSSAGP